MAFRCRQVNNEKLSAQLICQFSIIDTYPWVKLGGCAKNWISWGNFMFMYITLCKLKQSHSSKNLRQFFSILNWQCLSRSLMLLLFDNTTRGFPAFYLVSPWLRLMPWREHKDQRFCVFKPPFQEPTYRVFNKINIELDSKCSSIQYYVFKPGCVMYWNTQRL